MDPLVAHGERKLFDSPDPRAVFRQRCELDVRRPNGFHAFHPVLGQRADPVQTLCRTPGLVVEGEVDVELDPAHERRNDPPLVFHDHGHGIRRVVRIQNRKPLVGRVEERHDGFAVAVFVSA